MIKNISDFVAKTKMKPEINAVLITSNKIVATDSFKLIEITEDTGVEKPMLVALPKELKTWQVVASRDVEGEREALFLQKNGGQRVEHVYLEADNYPRYEEVMPKPEDEKFAITVSAKYLKEIATAFEGQEQFNQVTLHFFEGKFKPILFTTPNVRALLMPINK